MQYGSNLLFKYISYLHAVISCLQYDNLFTLYYLHCVTQELYSDMIFEQYEALFTLSLYTKFDILYTVHHVIFPRRSFTTLQNI